MKIILLENVTRLGKCGEIVEVKDGYARNYLVAKGAALEATDKNLKIYEQKKAKLEKIDAKRKAEAQEIAAKLSEEKINLAEEAKEDEELYGRVSAAEIADAINAEGYDVKKEQVLIADPIKKLGVYEVKVRLHPDVDAPVKVWVVKK